MSNRERAKQFMPFDAVKGLHEALMIEESKQEMMLRGEVSEDEASEISRTLLSLKNRDRVFVEFFDSGHKKSVSGKVKLEYAEGEIVVDGAHIPLPDILKIKVTKEE